MKKTMTARSLMLQTGLVGLASLLPHSGIASEAVLNPNQIKGIVEFSNRALAQPNPEVAGYLQQFGFAHASYIHAYNTTMGLRADAYPVASTETPEKLAYNMTVSTTEGGLSYNMSVAARMTNGYYWFDRKDSPPVFPEPSADVVLNHQECAAVVDVTYTDKDGAAVPITGYLTAEKIVPNGTNMVYQRKSRTHTNYNVSQLAIPIQGDGSSYRIRSAYISGTNAYVDRIAYECRHEITPSCDTVVPLTCQLADATALGQIDGNFDIVGAPIRANSSYMWATGGPFDNYRLTERFTNGAFSLVNMVPSEAEDVPKGYLVRGYSELGSGDTAERFYTPYDLNNKTMVIAGQTTDTNTKYQINPSIVTGAINLHGPSVNGSRSGLHDLVIATDTDSDNDGFPNDYYFSGVEATGTMQLPDNASFHSWGGHAKVAFGGVTNENNVFSSSYQLTAGGLNNQPSIWHTGNLSLVFDHPQPQLDGFLPMVLGIRNNHYLYTRLDPEQTYTDLDHQYCFSDVTLNYRSTSGKFYKPSATISGHFNASDFMNNTANYNVYGFNAFGLPSQISAAATSGAVKMTLPQGSYRIRPTVVPASGDGSAYGTQLPDVNIEVGCAQQIDISTGLQMQFDQPLPQQTRNSELAVSGTLSTNDGGTAVSVAVNGGDPVQVCNDCGDSFSTKVELQSGSNDLIFNATDAAGNSASITSTVTYIPNKLVLSCSDITITLDTLVAQTKVNYQLSHDSNCDSPATISCDPQDGSSFAIGKTAVSCSAQNSCGATASCGFSVIINEPLREPEPQCDGSAQAISQNVEVQSLWPANHKMVDVGFTRQATDDCDNAMDNGDLITEVWSNEPEIFVTASGGGNTAPDAGNIQGELQLRAERFGTGNGRIYLLLTKDSTGNAFDCDVVTVPHNQSPAAKAAIATEAQAAMEYCQQNHGAPVPAYFQHGMYNPAQQSDNGNGGGNGNGNGNGNGGNNGKKGKGRH